MEKRILFILAVVLGISLMACNKHEDLDETNKNKFFRTMFRTDECAVINSNDMVLAWYGIDEAAGYRVQVRYKSESFLTPLVDTILKPEATRIMIPDLQYGTNFVSRIMVLSPQDTLFHSDWFGDGSDDDNMELKTTTRYAIPTILTVDNITETSLRISWDLAYSDKIIVGGKEVDTPPIYQHALGSDGVERFLMDSISVAPTKRVSTEPKKTFKLTQGDLDRGYIEVTGLNPNSPYTINGYNNNIERFWDRHYNTINLRTKGEPGEPVLIEHVVDTFPVAVERGYSRIDTILRNYMDDITLAEGTTFLLEPGKKYFMYSNVNITKGFTLKTAGNSPNRAEVIMSAGLNEDGEPRTCNLAISRSPAGGEMGSTIIQAIRFDNINFHAPDAIPGYINEYGAWVDGTGNYFVNQSSSAMEFVCEAFEVVNCDFTGFRRGWFRTQGSQAKTLNRWIVDNCFFYNVGYRDQKGGGYSFFRGDGSSPNTNIFKDVRVTNSTFYDAAMNHLFDEEKGGKDYLWIGNPVWNIVVENCTFVNFSTLNSKKRMFSMEFAPPNSKITFRKNLMILTTARLAETNPRRNYSAGMYIKTRPFTFDFGDNFGTQGFLFDQDNFTSTSTGAAFHATQNPGGSNDAAIKFGATSILPEDLMQNPDSYNGLYYKNTGTVRNHEIYIQNIGDPRWRTGVTP